MAQPSRPAPRGSRPSNAAQPVRLALAPGVLGAICLLAGLAAVGDPSGTWFTIIRFAVAIVAVIMCVFAWQGTTLRWLWIPLLAAIAVVWNPVLPFAIDDAVLRILHILAAAAFLAAGLFIRVLQPAR